jgi:hypothetical protein
MGKFVSTSWPRHYEFIRLTRRNSQPSLPCKKKYESVIVQESWRVFFTMEMVDIGLKQICRRGVSTIILSGLPGTIAR